MRNIKRYMVGDDVWQVKQKLLELGYLQKATTKMFGNDSYRATKAFQAANNLEVDGIVGELTYAAMFAKGAEEPESSCIQWIPTWISDKIRNAVAADLATVSATRQAIVLDALQYCVDPSIHGDPKGFYIRGGNLYNSDLTCNVMTAARLKSYFKRTAYAPYYNNGRQEWMEAESEKAGYTIAGCDCSGLIVGLWRKAGVQSTGFDANANRLYSSYCVNTTTPVPGDVAWKSGHIGLYVGGGYVIESAGGEYGIQITYTKKRRAWSYTRKKLITLGSWTAFGDPKCY